MKYRTECYIEERKWLLTDNGKELFLQAGATYLSKTTEDFTIPYSMITDISECTVEELQEKQKSVIGRAIVGGALFGGIGAIVGGMSGVGTKTETVRKKLVTVTYQDNVLYFENNPKDGSSYIKKRIEKYLNK